MLEKHFKNYLVQGACLLLMAGSCQKSHTLPEESPPAFAALLKHEGPIHIVEKNKIKVWASDTQKAQNTVREAGYYRTYYQRELGLNQHQPITILICSSKTQWEETKRRYALHGTAQAFSQQSRVALLRDGTDREDWSDLAHEMAHVLLHQNAYTNMPLWVEEGLVQEMGFHAATSFFSLQNKILERKASEVPLVKEVSWMKQQQTYPENAFETAQYYRLSRQTIAQEIERLGSAKQVLQHYGFRK